VIRAVIHGAAELVSLGLLLAFIATCAAIVQHGSIW
jgi:hypothetical protein